MFEDTNWGKFVKDEEGYFEKGIKKHTKPSEEEENPLLSDKAISIVAKRLEEQIDKDIVDSILKEN